MRLLCAVLRYESAILSGAVFVSSGPQALQVLQQQNGAQDNDAPLPGETLAHAFQFPESPSRNLVDHFLRTVVTQSPAVAADPLVRLSLVLCFHRSNLTLGVWLCVWGDDRARLWTR